MSIFREESKMVRLTITIPRELRTEVADMAEAAGTETSLAQVIRVALQEGMRNLRRLMAGAPKCTKCGAIYRQEDITVDDPCPECAGTMLPCEGVVTRLPTGRS